MTPMERLSSFARGTWRFMAAAAVAEAHLLADAFRAYRHRV